VEDQLAWLAVALVLVGRREAAGDARPDSYR